MKVEVLPVELPKSPEVPISDRDTEIITSVQKFWEVEDIDEPARTDDGDIPDVTTKISEDFRKGVTFDADSKRYTTELPKRCDMDLLPDNFSL